MSTVDWVPKKMVLVVEPLPDSATGLAAFRVLKNGTSRAYEGVTFKRGNPGLRHALRRYKLLGWLETGDYGVLDFIDDQGDILADVMLARDGFQRIVRGLGLRVEGNR